MDNKIDHQGAKKSKKQVSDKLATFKFRLVNKDIFEAIKNGKKKVETRAATNKYRTIKKGDKIICACGREKFTKEVRSVKLFREVSSLLESYRPKQINPNTITAKELEVMYFSFPNYRDKIKKFGLIAFELK